jgi:ketosteroid isomerase-like protein
MTVYKILCGRIIPKDGNTLRNSKKLVYDNKDILLEYFKLIKNKDIGSLMELFAPDAIVYEPFSKITGGLKGKRAIESFFSQRCNNGQ